MGTGLSSSFPYGFEFSSYFHKRNDDFVLSPALFEQCKKNLTRNAAWMRKPYSINNFMALEQLSWTVLSSIINMTLGSN